MAREKGLLPISASFEVNYAGFLDAKMKTPFKSDLIDTDTFGAFAHKGMIVSVFDDIEENNGLYRLKDNDYTTESNWEKLGSGGTVSIDSLYFQNTTNTNQIGIIYKNNIPFLSDFSFGLNSNSITPDGKNIFLGDVGNFTIGSTATTSSQSSRNTLIGNNIAKSITRGYDNISIGSNNLTSITTGFENIVIGINNLNNLTSENNYIAIGNDITTPISTDGIAIGNSARAIGIAIGQNAGKNSNTTTSIAIGNNTLGGAGGNSSGSYNIALGNGAMGLVTNSNSYNIGIGAYALESLSGITASNNIAIGQNAGRSQTTGSNSVLIGLDAGRNQISGYSNVIIGANAGKINTFGVNATNNTFSVIIGTESRPRSTDTTNEIVIGYDARGEMSNSVVLGNNSITDTFLKGNIRSNTGNFKLFSTANTFNFLSSSDISIMKMEFLTNRVTMNNLTIGIDNLVNPTNTASDKLKIYGSYANTTPETLLRLVRPYNPSPSILPPVVDFNVYSNWTGGPPAYPYTRLGINLKSSVDYVGSADIRVLTLTDTARLGVGLNEPLAGIHLEGNSNSSFIRVDRTSSTINTILGVDSSVGYVGTLSDHSFSIKTNNVNRITINNLGAINLSAYTTAGFLKTDSSGNVTSEDSITNLTYATATGTTTTAINQTTPTVDFSLSDFFTLTMPAGDRTFTFSNPRERMNTVIVVTHETSNRKLTFPNAYWVGYTGIQTNGPGGSAYTLVGGTTRRTFFYITYIDSSYYISDVPYSA